MDIRRLIPADAAEYRRLRVEASLDASFSSDPLVERAIPLALLRKVLENPDSGEILGAFEENTLIGIVGLGRSEVHRTGTLFGLFVTRAVRGRGYGRALVRALVQRAICAELNGLELLVHSSNETARTLYEAEGFAAETDCEQAALRMRRSL